MKGLLFVLLAGVFAIVALGEDHCLIVLENNIANLTCDNPGDLITSIDDSSYLNDPLQTCPNGLTRVGFNDCTGFPDNYNPVINECVGLTSCAFNVTDAFFSQDGYTPIQDRSGCANYTRNFGVIYTCAPPPTRQWPANDPPVVLCTSEIENVNTQATCPPGSVINDVLFIDYGTPSPCQPSAPINFFASSPFCYSNVTQLTNAAKSICVDPSGVGFQSCTYVESVGVITFTNTNGATATISEPDPCPNTLKRFTAIFECALNHTIFTGTSGEGQITQLTGGPNAVLTYEDPQLRTCLIYDANSNLHNGVRVTVAGDSTESCCTQVGMVMSGGCYRYDCGNETSLNNYAVESSGSGFCYADCYAYGTKSLAGEAVPIYSGSPITGPYANNGPIPTAPGVYVLNPNTPIPVYYVGYVLTPLNFNRRRAVDTYNTVACRAKGTYDGTNCSYLRCGLSVTVPDYVFDTNSGVCWFQCVAYV